MYILLALLLWRTITNTNFGIQDSSEEQNFMDEFSKLVLGFLELVL